MPRGHIQIEGTSPSILNLGTGWRWVTSLMPRPLYLQRKSPWYQLIGGWMGPRDSMKILDKRKISCSCQDWNAQIVQPVS